MDTADGAAHEPLEVAEDDELSVSPLELFFDLVFVFAVAQVASFIRHDLTWPGVGRGLLLLVLMYWGWSLYTWALNAVGTHRLGVRLGLLAAMGTSLLMAVGLPEAFGDAGWYFAVAFFVFRALGTAMYYAAGDEHQRAAFNTFLPLSGTAAVVALVGGFVPTEWRAWVWILALGFDLASTRAAERADWHVQPAHFAERYGLLVILALGELIVAIGVGLGEIEATVSLGLSLGIAFLAVAALWWSYFDWASTFLEAALRRRTGIERSAFARDAYTMAHLPLVAGIVLFAVALEEVVKHPDEHLEPLSLVLLAGGITLVLLAFLLAAYRTTRRMPSERLIAAGLIVAVSFLFDQLAGRTLLAIHVVILVAALATEYVRWKRGMGRHKAGEMVLTPEDW